VSDNSINLLGFESNIEGAQTMNLMAAPHVVHIMTNHLGEKVTSNL
jgi:hypothetical protein